MRKPNGKFIECGNCKKVVYFPKHRLLKNANFCSKKCFNEYKKGKLPPNFNEFIKNSPLKKGMCPFRFEGEKHWNWNEKEPSYRAVHEWLRKTYGNACKCENPNCVYPRKSKRGKWIIKPTQYQWANINGIYKRNVNNFIQLCPSCHKLFDMGKIIL